MSGDGSQPCSLSSRRMLCQPTAADLEDLEDQARRGRVRGGTRAPLISAQPAAAGQSKRVLAQAWRRSAMLDAHHGSGSDGAGDAGCASHRMAQMGLVWRMCRRAAGCTCGGAGSGRTELGRGAWCLSAPPFAFVDIGGYLQRTPTCNALARSAHSHFQCTRTCNALAPATHSHLQRTRICNALAPEACPRRATFPRRRNSVVGGFRQS
eukprot:COSAG03_NODE_7450_length_917_cov_0.953545_1_plen_209_part_00